MFLYHVSAPSWNLLCLCLLNIAGGDADEKSSARFVHQAHVRRSIVIDLIEETKRRGHRAYKRVDMCAVRERAKHLPEDDVPPELIRWLPLDASHDKVLPNKTATPVSGEMSLEEIAQCMEMRRFNAVVCERSSEVQCDRIAQERSCVEHTVRTLKRVIQHNSNDALADGSAEETSDEGSDNDVASRVDHVSPRGGHAVSKNKVAKGEDGVASEDENIGIERIGVKTGNCLIDQVEFVYFGSACSLNVCYNCRFHDMPACAKHERYRRHEDAPRLETLERVRAMFQAAIKRWLLKGGVHVITDYNFGGLVIFFCYAICRTDASEQCVQPGIASMHCL